jgi:hypothetical protein
MERPSRKSLADELGCDVTGRRAIWPSAMQSCPPMSGWNRHD